MNAWRVVVNFLDAINFSIEWVRNRFVVTVLDTLRGAEALRLVGYYIDCKCTAETKPAPLLREEPSLEPSRNDFTPLDEPSISFFNDFDIASGLPMYNLGPKSDSQISPPLTKHKRASGSRGSSIKASSTLAHSQSPTNPPHRFHSAASLQLPSPQTSSRSLLAASNQLPLTSPSTKSIIAPSTIENGSVSSVPPLDSISDAEKGPVTDMEASCGGIVGSPVTCCAFSGCGEIMLSGHEDGSVCVWDTERGEMMHAKQKLHDCSVSGVVYCEGEGRFASCAADGRFTVWMTDLETDRFVVHCAEHGMDLGRKSVIRQPRFSEGGSMVIFPVQRLDGTLGLGSDATPAAQSSMRQINRSRLRLHSGGRLSLFIFKTDLSKGLSPPLIYHLELTLDAIPACIQLHTPENLPPQLLIGTAYRNRPSGRVRLYLNGSESRAVALNDSCGAFCGSGKFVVTYSPPFSAACEDARCGSCRVWDTGSVYSDDQNPMKELANDKGALVCQAEFTSNDRFLACCVLSDNLKVVLWDTRSWQQVHTLGVHMKKFGFGNRIRERWRAGRDKDWIVESLATFTMSRDKKWMGVVCGEEHQVHVWNVEQAVRVADIDLPRFLDAQGVGVVFGDSCRKLTAFGGEHHVLYTLRGGSDGSNVNGGVQMAELCFMDMHSGDNDDLCSKFSLAGRWLGLGFPNGCSMSLWDLKLGQRYTLTRSTLESREALEFTSFAISNNGDWLVSVMETGEMEFWDLSDADPISLGNLEFRSGESVRIALPCKCVAFSRTVEGGHTIVVCDGNGALIWYSLEFPESEQIVGSGQLHRVDSFKLGDASGQNVGNVLQRTGIRGGGGTFQKIPKAPQCKLVKCETQACAYDCLFSDDGERGLLMSDSRTFVPWSLVEMEAGRKVEYGIDFCVWDLWPDMEDVAGCMATFPKNVAMDGSFIVVGMDGNREFVKCRPETAKDDLISQVAYLPRHIALSPDGQWVVYSYPRPVDSREDVSDDYSPTAKFYIKRLDGDDCPEKELHYGNAELPCSLSISNDGRKIACTFWDNACVVVWTTHAVEGLLPDYSRLALMHRLQNKDELWGVLDAFGCSLLNFPDALGMSVLIHALEKEDLEAMKVMFLWAAETGNKVQLKGLKGFSDSGDPMDALEIALERASPKLTRLIMNYLGKGITSEKDMADIYRKSLLELGKRYPDLLCDALQSEKMLVEIGRVQVPESIFEGNRNRAFLVQTNKDMIPPPEKLKSMWKKKVDQYNYDVSRVEVPAIAKVVPYPNIAGIGCEDNSLASLVFNRLTHFAYSSTVLKALVWYKWSEYGFRLVLGETLHYIMMLTMFSMFAIALGDLPYFEKMYDMVGTSRAQAASVLLLSVWCFAVVGFLRLVIQFRNFWSHPSWDGFLFYMRSVWNWMFFASYGNLTIIIPIFYLLKWNVPLSAMVAIESVLIWWNLLRYLLAFENTGSLVIMIAEIIKDIKEFLLLAGMMIFGYGLAFYVLYREVRTNNIQCDELASGIEQERCEAVSEVFGSKTRTMLSLFTFTLGEVDLDVIHHAPGVLALFSQIMFVLYIIAMAIILLNLLIAIMADSYDRVKNTQKTEFVKARAINILNFEGMMSTSMKEAIKPHMENYLHILMPLHRNVDNNYSHRWEGRFLELQKRLRHDFRMELRSALSTVQKENAKSLGELESKILMRLDEQEPRRRPNLSLGNRNMSASFARRSPFFRNSDEALSTRQSRMRRLLDNDELED